MDREKVCMTAVANARLLKKHINLALRRKDKSSADFIRRLRIAYDHQRDILNRFTSIGLRIVCIGLVSVMLTGCGTYRPNTQKGWHLDEMVKHTEAINELDPIIYKVNKRVLPMQLEQMEEKLTWQQDQMAKMKAKREAAQ